MPDVKALKILFKHFWCSTGWVKSPKTTPAELAYAKAHDVMFDPWSGTHDDEVEWARRSAAAVNQKKVADAFVSSLSSRRMDLRSALGSYAIGRWLPAHSFVRTKATNLCPLCGAFDAPSPDDLSELNFERCKWGGVRHNSPVYIGFDLEQFQKLDVPNPNSTDGEILSNLLNAARTMAPKHRASHLQKTWAKLVASNADERNNLMQILGYCGILQPAGWPSFLDRFVPVGERDDHPNDTELEFPVSSWRGTDGVNEEAVRYWFGAKFCVS